MVDSCNNLCYNKMLSINCYISLYFTIKFIKKYYTSKLHKFGPYKDALKFVEKFKSALLMHWNKEIETGDLALIMKLVSKKRYSVTDAIEATLNDDF